MSLSGDLEEWKRSRGSRRRLPTRGGGGGGGREGRARRQAANRRGRGAPWGGRRGRPEPAAQTKTSPCTHRHLTQPHSQHQETHAHTSPHPTPPHPTPPHPTQSTPPVGLVLNDAHLQALAKPGPELGVSPRRLRPLLLLLALLLLLLLLRLTLLGCRGGGRGGGSRAGGAVKHGSQGMEGGAGKVVASACQPRARPCCSALDSPQHTPPLHRAATHTPPPLPTTATTTTTTTTQSRRSRAVQCHVQRQQEAHAPAASFFASSSSSACALASPSASFLIMSIALRTSFFLITLRPDGGRQGVRERAGGVAQGGWVAAAHTHTHTHTRPLAPPPTPPHPTSCLTLVQLQHLAGDVEGHGVGVHQANNEAQPPTGGEGRGQGARAGGGGSAGELCWQGWHQQELAGRPPGCSTGQRHCRHPKQQAGRGEGQHGRRGGASSARRQPSAAPAQHSGATAHLGSSSSKFSEMKTRRT